jgi:hypothetical protein
LVSYALLGLPSPQHASDSIWEGASDEVMQRYWCRNIGEFRALRHQLLAHWPKDRPVPRSLMRIALPTSLLRTKDFFTASVKAFLRRTRTDPDQASV